MNYMRLMMGWLKRKKGLYKMEFFKFGDKVEITQAGLDNGLERGVGKYNPTRYGVIVGHQRGNLIRVVRDGRNVSCSYHAKFWKLKT